MNYLGLCCIIKNEDEDYIREWIDYHLQIGVEKIFIYDNGSSIPVQQVVETAGARQQVQVIQAPGQTMQLLAYLHCLHTYGNAFRWLGFIDLDEFIYPKETEDLRVFLQEFEAYAALGIYWQIFGASGHEKKAGQSQIFNFSRRMPTNADFNCLIKCIVNPAQTFFPINPHYFVFANGCICVNEQHQRQLDQCSKGEDITARRIQVNHYYCRSWEEYKKKALRGRADIQQANHPHQADLRAQFDKINALAVAEDDGLRRLWEKLQKNPCKTPIQESECQPYDLTPELIETGIRKRIFTVMKDSRQAENPVNIVMALQVLTSRYPERLENHLLASETYNLIGFPNEAWEELEKARKMAPRSLKVINHIGRFLYAHKNLAEAEKAFKVVLQSDSKNEEALISLGKIFFESGRLDEALRLLQIATNIYPANQDAHAGLLAVQKALQKTRP